MVKIFIDVYFSENLPGDYGNNRLFAESILQEQQQSEVEGDSTSESDDSEEDSDATSAV